MLTKTSLLLNTVGLGIKPQHEFLWTQIETTATDFFLIISLDILGKSQSILSVFSTSVLSLYSCHLN